MEGKRKVKESEGSGNEEGEEGSWKRKAVTRSSSLPPKRKVKERKEGREEINKTGREERREGEEKGKAKRGWKGKGIAMSKRNKKKKEGGK